MHPQSGIQHPDPLVLLGICLGCCLLLASGAYAMGPRPEELPRFEGDPQSTVYESYSTARDGVLLGYTLAVQFGGCPDGATFELEVDSDRRVVMLPGVEQLGPDETCLRIRGIERGEDTATLRAELGGCERGSLAATIPVDCPGGCAPPDVRLRHDCAYAEAWVAGQPEIMDSRTAPRELGWLGGPHHTLVGFHFRDLRPGPLQILFGGRNAAGLEVVAVHFVSDPEAEHTARVESLGADENMYSAMVHAPGEYEMLLLLAGDDPLDRVEGTLIPPVQAEPLALRTDYAALAVPEGAVLDEGGGFSFAVDNCAGEWGRRNGLCPEPGRGVRTDAVTPRRSGSGDDSGTTSMRGDAVHDWARQDRP